MTFSVIHSSDERGARVGCLKTSHGCAETPCFLPIASHGSLRAISFEEAAHCGTKAVMANAWYLYRDAGREVLERKEGAHGLMKWNFILFTDSGGYQTFSLGGSATILDQGVAFDSGSQMLTPKKVVQMQKYLGSDVMFTLDDCPPYPCSKKRLRQAVRRTTSWARQSMNAHRRIPPCYAHTQQLWGIIQGSINKTYRMISAQEVGDLAFSGYGIGGLSIGMPRTAVREMTVLTCDHLPWDKPRHLLGVGLPGQILEGIEDGVDTFDCVLPIRKGQRGIAYTTTGEVKFKGAQPKDQKDLPLDPECDCPTCKKFSREELRGLFRTEKFSAGHLAVIHNIWFYQQLMERARSAIKENRFSVYKEEFLSRWSSSADH